MYEVGPQWWQREQVLEENVATLAMELAPPNWEGHALKWFAQNWRYYNLVPGHVRKLVRAVLQKQGYTILESQDVRHAIELTTNRQGPIDLLLTDVVMPDLSGPELVEQLTRIHPEMKVLYMSGYADSAIVRHGVLPPDADFVQKPFAPEALHSKIREVLDRSRPS